MAKKLIMQRMDQKVVMNQEKRKKAQVSLNNINTGSTGKKANSDLAVAEKGIEEFYNSIFSEVLGDKKNCELCVNSKICIQKND